MSTQVMAWGQGVQDSDQPPGTVPALALSWCPQSRFPPTDPGRAPTCLTLGPQEALGTVAGKGPREVLAGPTVLAGLRLALVNIWGSVGREVPAQHRWLVARDRGLERQHFSHRAQTLPMSFASPSPLVRNIPAPAPAAPCRPLKHMAWAHSFGDTWGQPAVQGCAKRSIPQDVCVKSPHLTPNSPPSPTSVLCQVPGNWAGATC